MCSPIEVKKLNLSLKRTNNTVPVTLSPGAFIFSPNRIHSIRTQRTQGCDEVTSQGPQSQKRQRTCPHFHFISQKGGRESLLAVPTLSGTICISQILFFQSWLCPIGTVSTALSPSSCQQFDSLSVPCFFLIINLRPRRANPASSHLNPEPYN